MTSTNKKWWGGLAACLALLLFLAVPMGAAAQSADYNRAESMSDEQLLKLMAQAESQGRSQEEVFTLLRARGMSAGEIAKLQTRVIRLREQKAGRQNRPVLVDTTTWGRSVAHADDYDLVDTAANKLQDDKKPKIFGSALFRNGNIRFEPNLNMPTPADYIVGPGDQLNLDITGDREAVHKLTVSVEGSIRVDYIGMVDVGGLSIEAVRSKLKHALAEIYPGLRTGRTRLDVNLGNIRSIKITMTGNVTQPGTYTLPSFATVYNALYAAGGPSEQGSYRHIRIIRNNVPIGTVDAYDFLANGVRSGDIRLEDQDVIHIPVYRKRVEVSGMVKNPGLFEPKDGEHLSDVLDYAGGFAPDAYTDRIKALKMTDRERALRDVYAGEFATYNPKNGDQYVVEEVLDRYANRVLVEGAVFRPGDYELTDGLTVGQLIAKGGGIREDAFTDRGYINRLNADNTQQLVAFDLRKLLGGQIADIPLQREDRVFISSIFDLREEYAVSINGEVRMPGKLRYADGMTLGSAIQMAGGLTDAANIERIEVARRIRRSVNERDSIISELMVVDFGSREQALQSGFELHPFDVVNIRVSTGYLVQKQVRIEGEVKYPGVYTLTRRDERISDLLKRAGGLTDFAYPRGASLYRTASDAKLSNESILASRSAQEVVDMEESERSKLQTEALENQEDEKVSTSTTLSNYVGIRLERIVQQPSGKYDLLMEDGDVLTVPRRLATVTVRGQVLNANRIRYEQGKPLTYYIDQAGGFTSDAHRKKTFVQYANGTVAATRSGILRRYPKVEAGADIIVPEKAKREKVQPQVLVGVMSAIVSMSAVVVSLLR